MKVSHPCPENSFHFSILVFDFHDFGESNGEWGWKDFAEIDRLFEADSGLVVSDRLKLELNVFVRPKSAPLWPADASETVKSVIVRILTDRQMKREIGTLHCQGLPLFEEGRSYCFYEQMRYNQLEKLVARDLRLDPEDLRFWLCEQLPHGHVRIVRNLSNVQNLTSMGDVTELKNALLPSVCSESMEVVMLYVELPVGDEETVKELGSEDYLAFCKYYDPWKMQLTYIGTVPLRRGCTSAEVILDARMLARLRSNAAVEVYVEAPPGREIVRKLELEDDIDAVRPTRDTSVLGSWYACVSFVTVMLRLSDWAVTCSDHGLFFNAADMVKHRLIWESPGLGKMLCFQE